MAKEKEKEMHLAKQRRKKKLAEKKKKFGKRVR